MNNSPAQTNSFKRSSSQDSFTGKSTMFVPAKVARINPKTMGIEYRADVADDAEYIKKIFETNTYEHNREGLVEFYSDVYYIMDTKEASDKRNVGTIMGMASLGVLGFAAFGITLVGGLAGIIFGGALGRMIAAKIADLRRKKEVITQEDLYLLKAKCMVELATKQKKTARLDLNKFRLNLEKVLEESSLTLEISLFQKPKLVNDIRFQLRNLLMDPDVQLSTLLAYRLFKAFLQRNDMDDPKNLERAARKVYGIFVPYVKFIELGPEIPPEAREDPSLVAYFKLKSFISKQEIVDIIERFPEYQTTPEALENFKVFLKQEVNITEPMKKAMTQSRQSATEHAALKRASRSSKSPDQGLPGRLPNNDDSLISCPSMKGSQYEELGEGVTAYNADLYLSQTKKNHTPIPSHNNLNAAPKDVVIDIGHNSYSQYAGTWARMPSMNKNASMKLGNTFKGDQSEDIDDFSPVKRSQNQEETKVNPQNEQQKVYSKVGAKSIENSHSQAVGDRSQLISLDRSNQADSPMSKLKKQQSTINTPKNQNSSPSNKLLKEKEENNDLFNNGIVGNVQNKVIFDKVISICNDNVSKWEKVITNPTMKIEKIKPEGSPVILIRAFALVDGYPPEEVFEQIYNTVKRSKWDSVLASMNIVESIDDNTAIIHFIVKGPVGISDRDFVQRRIYQRDFPEKGTITMGFQSFSHPKCPPVKNRIRAETHIAGYILRPSAKDPRSTDLCLITQVDIKGAIPKMVVNIAAAKSSADWIHKLVKACERDRQERNKK